jgi:hypothetical protein
MQGIASTHAFNRYSRPVCSGSDIFGDRQLRMSSHKKATGHEKSPCGADAHRNSSLPDCFATSFRGMKPIKLFGACGKSALQQQLQFAHRKSSVAAVNGRRPMDGKVAH